MINETFPSKEGAELTYIERIGIAVAIIVFIPLAAAFVLMGLQWEEVMWLAALGALVVALAIWSLLRLVDFALGGPDLRAWRRERRLLTLSEGAQRVHSTRSNPPRQSW